jgi:hypothetical protein
LSFSILLVAAFLLAFYRFIIVSNSHSFGWDSAGFMENAAVFAGFGNYNQGFEPSRPPFLPIVLSFLFRLTGPSAYDGYLLSGALYFLAILGGYLLAREVMNPFLAIIPASSFAVPPMVILWEGIMYSNVEGVAIAAIALAMLAFSTREGNSRFFVLAIPLLILAPLTRFTMGVILISGFVYLLALGNVKRTCSNRYFLYGLTIAFVIGLGMILPWLVYTLLLGFPVTKMIPSPSELNPFQSSLGRAFFPINFPSEIGVGLYGYVITALVISGFIYLLLRLALFSYFRTRSFSDGNGKFVLNQIEVQRNINSDQIKLQEQGRRRKNAMTYAVLTWFVFLFLYYTLLWPYDDLRYSIEFILPALILGYFFLGQVFERLYSLGQKSGHRLAVKIGSISLIALILISIIFLAAQSGVYVNESTPVVDMGISSGMRQAASWVQENVPTSAKIEADWYTFGRWYLADYNVSVAPAAYQLQTTADYQNWQNTIASNHISYVIYSNPSEIKVPSNFHAVFSSTNGEIVVYQVSS